MDWLKETAPSYRMDQPEIYMPVFEERQIFIHGLEFMMRTDNIRKAFFRSLRQSFLGQLGMVRQ